MIRRIQIISMDNNTTRNECHQSGLIKFFKQPCLLVLHIICVLITLLSNLSSSWLIVNDLYQQLPGLVFGKISKFLFISYILFSIIESVLSITEVFLWINILRRRYILWITVDCITTINIFLAEIPLSILYTYTCACQESAISMGFILKGGLIITLICIRLSVCFISCVYEKLNNVFTDSNSNIPNESECLLGNQKSNIKETNEMLFDMEEKSMFKQKLWLFLRVVMISGFFCLIILMTTIFTFIFIQPYPTYIQWYQVDEDKRISFLNLTTPQYFHNVEIFLEEKSLNHSEIKWLHLLSLKQIIRLHYIHANESVTLGFYTYTEDDLYKESICHMSKNHSIRITEAVKIYFRYIPPTKQQHLGNVVYNAMRIISNG
ncbi:unnamed protein product [Trichobilharzia regenti]|nr:unnamed protein product [Trichobilharzia regenti]